MQSLPSKDMSASLPTHIVLVGLMGTGKSSVGRKLASQLQRTFVDTDKRVEEMTGKSVRDIFIHDGEEAFRALESKVVIDVLQDSESSVIAAAGGVVTRPENRKVLLESCSSGATKVIWLRADTAELLARVQKGVHRPLLDADPSGTLTAMERDRTPWYEEVASFVVDTNGLSIEQVASSILAVLEKDS
jgi:shikimate kinase